MGLLSVLKLPPPRQLAEARTAADEARRALGQFATDTKAHLGSGHPQAEQLRKIAVAAGADAKMGLWEEVKKKIEQGKALLNGVDAGSKTKTGSAVEPGAAEQSLEDFAGDIESTVGTIRKAQSALSVAKGDAGVAKALGDTADALGQVAEGLGKVGDAAGKVLEIAAAARKLEECRLVLARARAVDFSTGDPVEGAKAMGDLAKLFGEFGAEATKEVPLLKGYFQLISRLGEIWVPFAKMVVRRNKQAVDASEDKNRMQAPPEPKGVAADTSRIVALADLAGFLDECHDAFDRSGQPNEARLAREIRDNGAFDEMLDKLLAAIEKGHGLKAQFAHKLADATSLELPVEKFLQQDLKKSWTACYAVAQELEKELGRFAWMGVSYVPAVKSLERARPKKA